MYVPQLQAFQSVLPFLGIKAIGNVDVQVPLQNMIENTIDGILSDPAVAAKIFELIAKYGEIKLIFLYKFGSDGSSGHPKIKQIVDEERQQGSLYATSFVPMQILAQLPNGDYVIGNVQL